MMHMLTVIEHANQGRLIKAYEEVPNATAYESAIAHLHKVSIKEGFDLLFGDKGLDLVGVPMDSKIPSMATASGSFNLASSTNIVKPGARIPHCHNASRYIGSSRPPFRSCDQGASGTGRCDVQIHERFRGGIPEESDSAAAS